LQKFNFDEYCTYWTTLCEIKILAMNESLLYIDFIKINNWGKCKIQNDILKAYQSIRTSNYLIKDVQFCIQHNEKCFGENMLLFMLMG
jgi:hypothetical protein